MEPFETTFNVWKPLTVVSRSSALYVAGFLDPYQILVFIQRIFALRTVTHCVPLTDVFDGFR